MDKVNCLLLNHLPLNLCLFICLIIIATIYCSDTIGDRPRPLPVVDELKHATDVTERKTPPAWDYDVRSLL